MNEEIKKRIEAARRGDTPEGYTRSEHMMIPDEWGVQPLSELSTILSSPAGEGCYETLSISAGIGFVNQAEKFGKELSGKQYEKYTVLQRGDFAYNKGNSKTFPQGCTYQLKDRDEAAVPNVFECFRMAGVEPEYYAQLFESGFMNHQLSKKINHGVRDDGLLNLTEEDFFSTVLPVPPSEEQQRIAEILETCDNVISLHQKLLEEYKQLKRTCLAKMFPRGGSTTPELRFSGFTDAWEQRKLGDISESYSGGTPTAGKSEYYGGDIPFIRSAEVNSESTELFLTESGLNNSSAKMVKKGDVLYALYGATSGETGIARLDGAINQAILDIKPHIHFDSQFIMQWLRKNKEKIIGTYLQGGQGNLSGTIVTSLMIDCPNYEEQRAIGSFFANIDNLITLHQRKIEEVQKKKKALMQLLLTGLVRVGP